VTVRIPSVNILEIVDKKLIGCGFYLHVAYL
jgi:hypothetical protein